jgi:hypothetical protein
VSLGNFEEFVERIISMFKGRLIPGILDELPPADISRVRRVSEIANRRLG